MNSGNPWKPNDWIRLAALIGAFLLFAIGALMLFYGVTADGVVDIKSTILSGTIKASSAGLYLCFFAMFIIVFVLVTAITRSKEKPSSDGKPGELHIMRFFWTVLGLLFLSALGIAFTDGTARAGFIAFMFLMVLPLIALVIKMLDS